MKAGVVVSIILALLLAFGYSQRHELYLEFKYSIPARDTEWISRYGYDPEAVVPLSFGADYVGVPLVDVTIDGARRPVILDTGTNGIASLSDGEIDALGLEVVDEVKWLDAGGAVRARVPVARADKLSLGPVEIGDARIVGMGPEAIMGRRDAYSGTIGWVALAGHRVTLDYANGLLAFGSDPLPPDLVECPGRQILDVHSPEHLPGLLLVEAAWNGDPILAQVDTGKSSTVFDREVFAPGELAEQDIRVADFAVPIRHARFSSLRSFETPGGLPVLLGLGSDFLVQFLVTIDYPGRKLVLERRVCGEQSATAD